MARSIQLRPSEVISQREAARLAEKLNRAKGDLRELIKLWRSMEKAREDTSDALIWKKCADQLEHWMEESL